MSLVLFNFFLSKSTKNIKKLLNMFLFGSLIDYVYF